MGSSQSTWTPTVQDDGDQEPRCPGSPGLYHIEPIPEVLKQAVYSKYEEAFRLGLEAFSNPMRTNKFRRQLPHILGTLEFHRNSHTMTPRGQAFVPISTPHSRNKKETLLPRPSNGVTTLSSSQGKPGILASFPLLGDSTASGFRGSETMSQMPSTGVESVMPSVEAAIDGPCMQDSSNKANKGSTPEANTASEHPGAGDMGTVLDGPQHRNRGLWPMGQAGAQSKVCSPGSPSESQSDGRAWHSASSGSHLTSPKSEDFGPDDVSLVCIEEVGATALATAERSIVSEGNCDIKGLRSSASHSTGDEKVDPTSLSAVNKDQPRGQVPKADILKGMEPQLPESLSSCLEGGLFDDEDLSSKLEHLQAVGNGTSMEC